MAEAAAGGEGAEKKDGSVGSSSRSSSTSS